MKLKKILSALPVCALAMSFLLGASTASAATVIFGDPTAPNKATAISGLVVDGSEYFVSFIVSSFANEIYGPFAGDFPIFNTAIGAENAVFAVNAALQGAGATAIGEDGLPGVDAQGYNIGYESFILPIGDVESIFVWRGANESGSEWTPGIEFNELSYNLDERAWADFTFVTPVQVNTWGVVKSFYR
jgi:hypothetical protein